MKDYEDSINQPEMGNDVRPSTSTDHHECMVHVPRRPGRYSKNDILSEMNVDEHNKQDPSVLNQKITQKCMKSSWMDGTFFEIASIEGEHYISATCKTCKKVFRGDDRVSSNFTNHLKVILER